MIEMLMALYTPKMNFIYRRVRDMVVTGRGCETGKFRIYTAAAAERERVDDDKGEVYIVAHGGQVRIAEQELTPAGFRHGRIHREQGGDIHPLFGSLLQNVRERERLYIASELLIACSPAWGWHIPP